MLRKAFHQNSEENRVIKLILVFALIFASAHVALHDLGVSGEVDGHGECQTCRLNHVPVASLGTPALFVPLQFLTYLLPIEDNKYQLSSPFQAQWTRAPPLV